MKKEKNYLDPGSNNSSTNKLINLFFPYHEEELKTIQRSIALLRQDLPKIIEGELFKFQNQKKGDMY
jgi:hypothetical protein